MGATTQTTIKAPVRLAGVGLHSGSQCRISILPAPAGSGIVLRRCDIDPDGADNQLSTLIHARPENVAGADHGTRLANGYGASVSTVEHLMAALALLSLDNVMIDVDGPEIPIFDGSAEHLVTGLKQVGVKSQEADRLPIVIAEPIRVDDGDRYIEFTPGDTSVIDIDIDFGDCLIGRQILSVDLENSADRDRLAVSRTFCRLYEVDGLRRAGLIRGGSLENSLVVDGQDLLNDQPLRDQHEFALHKALDLIGDLYLLGRPIRGAIRAVKPGHDLNVRAALAVARTISADAQEARPLAATA